VSRTPSSRCRPPPSPPAATDQAGVHPSVRLPEGTGAVAGGRPPRLSRDPGVHPAPAHCRRAAAGTEPARLPARRPPPDATGSYRARVRVRSAPTACSPRNSCPPGLRCRRPAMLLSGWVPGWRPPRFPAAGKCPGNDGPPRRARRLCALVACCAAAPGGGPGGAGDVTLGTLLLGLLLATLLVVGLWFSRGREGQRGQTPRHASGQPSQPSRAGCGRCS
jgi:hypothetical protein